MKPSKADILIANLLCVYRSNCEPPTLGRYVLDNLHAAKSAGTGYQTLIYNHEEFQSEMTDLIVKSGVKEVLADHAVSSDFYDAFNEEVADLIEEAAERAEANDRKTVQPRDL